MCWSAWWCPIVPLGSVHFSSFFLFAPQTRRFQMFDLQICLSFILPAQICRWLPVVSFLFQLLLLFSSKICLVSSHNFCLFIEILCSYIFILISFRSLSIISFSSFHIFKTVGIMSLTDNSNVWAFFIFCEWAVFSSFFVYFIIFSLELHILKIIFL